MSIQTIPVRRDEVTLRRLGFKIRPGRDGHAELEVDTRPEARVVIKAVALAVESEPRSILPRLTRVVDASTDVMAHMLTGGPDLGEATAILNEMADEALDAAQSGFHRQIIRLDVTALDALIGALLDAREQVTA